MRTEDYERGCQHILDLIGEQLFDDYNEWDNTRHYEALGEIQQVITAMKADAAAFQRLKNMKVDGAFVESIPLEAMNIPGDSMIIIDYQAAINLAIKLAESQESEG